MFTRVRFVFLGVALLCSLSVFAQTLSGVVTDQKSREGLISATVQLIAGDGKINYTSTDLKGMFQFKKLPAGTYTLQISYVGYKTYKEAVIIPSSPYSCARQCGDFGSCRASGGPFGHWGRSPCRYALWAVCFCRTRRRPGRPKNRRRTAKTPLTLPRSRCCAQSSTGCAQARCVFPPRRCCCSAPSS